MTPTFYLLFLENVKVKNTTKAADLDTFPPFYFFLNRKPWPSWTELTEQKLQKKLKK